MVAYFIGSVARSLASWQSIAQCIHWAMGQTDWSFALETFRVTSVRSLFQSVLWFEFNSALILEHFLLFFANGK